MNRFRPIAALAASIFTYASLCQAQDCRNWGNQDLRGTYALTGQGWMDFSKLAPSMPAGSLPSYLIGAMSLDGRGGGGGWASANAGGIQMTNELVKVSYDVKPDCSVLINFSIKTKELGGGVLGPLTRVAVIAGRWPDLELFSILAGMGPGMPTELVHFRRISMQAMDFK